MTLRLILGDQLNHDHSWYKNTDENVIYCLFEMRQETDYVAHHIQKVVAFFAAMRAFAEHLENGGNRVVYYRLDEEKNTQSLTKNLQQLIAAYSIKKFEYQLPDEYRLDEQLKTFCMESSIETEVFDTEHFMTKRHELEAFFEGKKTYLMESFYRDMRKRYDIMMDGKNPVTGQWNYDKQNRKKMPKKHVPPAPLTFDRDVTEIVKVIENQGVKTIGWIDANNFVWPVTRVEGLEILEFFCKKCLVHFGDFQDAMTPEYWSNYHSRISFALNAKLISPLEVVQRVVEEWEERKDEIHISQTEGFVRQVIGWREYMRGIYWAKMPEFATLNFFEHDRKLPDWFWTGKTKMKCLQHSIGQSLEYAYAHHIQRLMVTGNFALLAGIDPNELDEWYLGIYIDAIEWVEITNTRGMSQFADGGIVGTKPYVGSANYMHKQSHYCTNCVYNHKEKLGKNACPFNSLYWNFYDRHRDKLGKNPRIGMMYRVWDRMGEEQQTAVLKRAAWCLEHIEEL